MLRNTSAFCEPIQPKSLEELHEKAFEWRMEMSDELLIGAIDSHVHAGPVLASNPGRFDPIEVAQMARDAGMRSIVYYSVFGNAAEMAWITNRHVPGIRTYGGYLMNLCQGGLNPRAVRTALAMEEGCRFVSFGSHCTYASVTSESTLIDGKPVPFVDAFPKFRETELPVAVRIPLEGAVPPELDEILSMVAEKPWVYLNTGHVSVPEAFRILELSKQYGIKKVLIAHPTRGAMTVEQQKQAAAQGAFLEGCAGDWFFPDAPHTHYYAEKEYQDLTCLLDKQTRYSTAHWMRTLREVGPEHFVLGTDYGIRSAPSPIEGMRMMISLLLDYDFSYEEIRKMTVENPAKLIGMD